MVDQILQYIIEIDKFLLVFINSLHNSFFDIFMTGVSSRFVWIPMYCALLYMIIVNKKWRSLYLIVFVVLAVVAADQFSAFVCKPYFCRLRPSHEPSLQGFLHYVGDFRGDLYGFISSHAANTFAVAILLNKFIKDKYINNCLIAWAFLNAYSRAYLGMHYPLDLICGAISGWLIACLIVWIYNLIRYSLKNVVSLPRKSELMFTTNKWDKLVFYILYAVSFGVIFI